MFNSFLSLRNGTLYEILPFQWASDMSCRLLAVYNEEFEKRREFQSQFEGHFLQSLFPGFEDNPPPFATQAPAPFDVNLPEVSSNKYICKLM